ACCSARAMKRDPDAVLGSSAKSIMAPPCCLQITAKTYGADRAFVSRPAWCKTHSGAFDRSGRILPLHYVPANDRNRRVTPVGPRSGDRLLSEPTAGTQPCRREPLFMPRNRPLISTR